MTALLEDSIKNLAEFELTVYNNSLEVINKVMGKQIKLHMVVHKHTYLLSYM